MVRSTVNKLEENHLSRRLYLRDIKELLGIMEESGNAILNITTYEMIYSSVKGSWGAFNEEGYLSPDVTEALENQRPGHKGAAVIRLSEYLCAIDSVKDYGRGAHRLKVRDGIFDCMFLLELFQLNLVGRHAGDFMSAVSTIRLGSDSYEAWVKKRASENRNVRIKGIERLFRIGDEEVVSGKRNIRNAKQLTLFDIIHVAFEQPVSRL